MKKIARKPRVYKLKSNKTPLSLLISSRHSKHKPLIHWDEEKQENRTLRYATNQRSIFEDEQDGTAIVGSIVFEDGFLNTRIEETLLQQFLELHPDNGTLFVEVDAEQDAAKEVEVLSQEVDALVAASSLEIEQMETLAKLLLGSNVSRMKSSEIKRDILLYAKNYPEEFLEALDDDDMELQGLATKAFEQNILQYRAKKREIYFNLADNKKRLMVVPFGEDYTKSLISYFHTRDGEDVLDYLEKKVK